ncbi:MAG: alpha-2-macroglobulin family protein, partial [Hyphomicrobiales bacterium]|nr:alpha-2-macroglobulin family protein [Hyphomicrobiales bacterium]
MIRTTFTLVLTAALMTVIQPLVAQSQSARESAAQSAPFAHDGVARDAARYEAWLKGNWRKSSTPVRRHRATGFRLLGAANEPRAASRAFAQAIANDGRDAASWVGLARALLAIPTKELQGAERYNIPVNASGAAYFGYQRASDKRMQAQALAVLGQALARRSYWRPALDAYKTSLKLVDDAAVRQVYDDLHGQKGFRIITYKVENETSSPRLCIEFSESLK